MRTLSRPTACALACSCGYPIPQTAAQLTLAEFKAFATAHAYPHPQQLPAALARLRDPYPVAAATTVEVYAGEA